jgi:lipopolysaccharide export system protein LptC
MSVQAEVERTRRQHWAAAGGSHDRLVRALQLGLPAAVGALAAVLLFAPFSQSSEIGFLLAKDAIEVAPQRMRVEAARYTGSDSQGRPFSLTAASAVQRSAADPVVRLSDLSAMIILDEGPATLNAEAGRYDPSVEQVTVDGPLRFVAADGYSIETGDVGIDLKARTLASDRAVNGRLPIGRFSANRLRADLAQRTVTLSGNARLRIEQGVVR